LLVMSLGAAFAIVILRMKPRSGFAFIPWSGTGCWGIQRAAANRRNITLMNQLI